MKIDRIVNGLLEENCYILSIDDDILIIDPGEELDKIIPFIKDKNILGILVTHNHKDHTGCLEDLNNIIKTTIYKCDNLEEKEYTVNRFKFKVIFTKGHTNDSVTYYFKEDNIMFTGDFLFNGTIGRTDLPTGDDKEMINSLELISKYDKSIKYYPGHGEYSYLKEFDFDYFINYLK